MPNSIIQKKPIIYRYKPQAILAVAIAERASIRGHMVMQFHIQCRPGRM